MIAIPAGATFNPPAYDYGPNAVNMIPFTPYAPLPASATQAPSGDREPVLPSTVPVPALPANTVKAGIAKVDGTWRVGASAGQYGTDITDYASNPTNFVGDHFRDPNQLSTKKVPSWGIETRATFRALVIEGADGKRIAQVANDFYISQDLVNRRVAAILREHDLLDPHPTGIDSSNLSVYISHDHSSPFYSSTGWGVWAFQDVFDLRFFEYVAHRMADAVIAASADVRPVRMGATTVPFDYTQRHSFGPATADDGTPAGYPKRDNDLTISVLRFDDITNRAAPKPYAIWYVFGQHPEFTEGNNLITEEWPGKVYQMLDAETGATSIFSQNNTGTTEPDRNGETHAPAARAEFEHKDYAQQERGARQIANAVIRGFNSIGTGQEIPGTTLVGYQPLDFPVRMMDLRLAPPYSHPLPTVSNCKTQQPFQGTVGVPVAGLPDCERRDIPGWPEVAGKLEGTKLDPGVTYAKLVSAGLAANYGAPSYTGLEETIEVHLQAIRLGDVLITVCPCEQWGDQSRDIKSRADKIPDNVWVGWDWSQFCQRKDDATWTCPRPNAVANYDGDPSNPPPGGTVDISNNQYDIMRAEVNNDAKGWDDIENIPYAESEDINHPENIKGNYTHTELTPQSGYKLVVTAGHANDYWGYIATYREYMRGDHYRKALSGLGAHGSDWLATRLVGMGGALNDASDSGFNKDFAPKIKYKPLDDAYMLDNANQEARAAALAAADPLIEAYERSLPVDAGTPAGIEQPHDIQRFDRADFTWVGGDNYVDSPNVTVEREVAPGQWVTQGNSFGDVQVDIEYPEKLKNSTATYRSGSFTWKWHAHFEAFDSDIDTASFGRQTPAGTYRFVVNGNHRTGVVPKTKPYTVISSNFQVKPWEGITVPTIQLDGDGHVSFSVGPTVVRDYNTDEYKNNPQNPAHMHPETVGPIAYPDVYQTSAYPTSAQTGDHIFPRIQRNEIVDQHGVNTHQRWCFSCSFRPWKDTGTVASAMLHVTHSDGTTTDIPTAQGSGASAASPWRSGTTLAPCDSAQVLRAGIHDTFGEFNGGASAIVQAPSANGAPCPTPPSIGAGGAAGGSSTQAPLAPAAPQPLIRRLADIAQSPAMPPLPSPGTLAGVALLGAVMVTGGWLRPRRRRRDGPV
ncbi:MAG: hypothetical protein QOE92_1963 [Chloroflexota bacterium]|nr:hypothetical protein [Chloroflexota bacterium]